MAAGPSSVIYRMNEEMFVLLQTSALAAAGPYGITLALDQFRTHSSFLLCIFGGWTWKTLSNSKKLCYIQMYARFYMYLCFLFVIIFFPFLQKNRMTMKTEWSEIIAFEFDKDSQWVQEEASIIIQWYLAEKVF